MALNMTPRERFLTALAGGMPDRVSMIIWNNKLLGGRHDEMIFSMGACLIVKSCVWKMTLEGVDVEIREEEIQGSGTRQITHNKTAAGDLSVTERILPGTVWIEKYPFKDSDDYEALEALISARTYQPDYETFLKDDTFKGVQSIARPMSIRSPMQEIIYEFMGLENFSIEFAENRDRVLHLKKTLKRDWEKRVQMTAESPAKYAVIDGNTEYSVIGAQRYKQYFYPRIQEGCDILHEHGLLAGAHLDGNNRSLAPMVAETSLDFIESFTPAPETDLSIQEARAFWPDKALQIHFPSSVHLDGKEGIEKVAVDYLKQASPGNGFVMGISEDLPNRGVETMVPFFRFFHEHGELPLNI